MQSVVINGISFSKIPGVRYRFDYYKVALRVMEHPELELSIYRQLIREDLFFLIYFILGNKSAHHPFVVQACADVQDGPRSNTIDIWGREHFKTSIITVGETIQDILKDPEERIGIFSYSKEAASKLIGPIKLTFESNQILKDCFRDILFDNPATESPCWSEEKGLVVRRRGCPKEPTVEACGLIKGMPTGSHFTVRKYDDIETEDLVNSPDLTDQCKRKFDMSQYLGAEGGRERIVGTYYSHLGPLVYIQNKKLPNGEPIYSLRKKPGVENGDPGGKPVLLSEERMNVFRADKRSFFTQIVLDPTPSGEGSLDPSLLKVVPPSKIPKYLFKFLIIDPAGDEITNKGDCWSIMLVGVEPFRDDLGASDVYVLDLVLDEMTHANAMHTIVGMHMRGGMIMAVGVEKVGISSTEIHVANALFARGVHISQDAGTLKVLRPQGRKKESRIVSNLQLPLQYGKIKVSEAIPEPYRNRLGDEMRKFPFWHNDGLDTLSYAYDLIKDFRFPAHPPEAAANPDTWMEDEHTGRSWMTV